MKKFTLFALAIFAVSLVQAQFVKGDRYLGGTASIYYTNEETSPNNSPTNERRSIGFNLAPSFMKFKTEKFALGFKVSGIYDNTKTKNLAGTVTGNSYGFGAGIFGFHVIPIGKGFFLAAETGVGGDYVQGKTDYRPVSDTRFEGSEFNIAAYVTPSFSYKITNKLIVGVNFANLLRIGYSNHKEETTHFTTNTITTIKRSGFNIASNFNNTSVGQLGITFGLKLK